MASAPQAATPPPSPPPAAYAAPSAPATRPTGVTILAVLAIIAGVFAVIGGLIAFAAGAFLGAMGAAGDSGMFGLIGAAGAVVGVFMLAYAAFAFAVAYGLFKRLRWAWYAALVLGGLSALGGLTTLFGEPFSGLLQLALAGLVIWYLLSPPVQAWFGVRHNTPWKYKDSHGM